MGVYEERTPPTTGMHWQPGNSQERGSGLSLGCQGGPGIGGGAGVVVGAVIVGTGGSDQTRDLSPCLPASMGDAARPTTLPSSPTPPQQQQQQQHHHHHHNQQQHTCNQPGHTSLHQTHCGTNNNCYNAGSTSYDSRDYGSPGDTNEYRNNNYEHPNDLSMPPQTTPHHNHHHHHHHHHHHQQHQQTILHQSQIQPTSSDQQQQQQGSEHNVMHAIPKLEPPSTPPSHQDHDHGPAVVCAGCGLRISDRFYLQAVDRRWHISCLQCSHCRQGLDGEVTCFSRDGNIYCKKDYYRMFGSMKRCARCQTAILASELVMRARELVFHVRCFSCAACSVPLTKGDHFGMRDGTVLCRMHYEMGAELHPSQSPPVPVYPPGPHYPGQSFPSSEFLHVHHPHHLHPHSHGHRPIHPNQHHQQQQQQQQQQQSPVSLQPSTPSGVISDLTGGGGGTGGSPPKMPYFNGASPVVAATAVTVATAVANVPAPRQKGRPRKRKPKDLEAMTASLDLNADYIDMPFGRGGPGTPGMPGTNSRTKRMRTSFKHHQLRTMKSYFAINHNPDAKDLKQLSQKTGLPKRVLQVWFQNARAKWRRMVLKQEGKSDKCGGSLGPGGVDSGSLSELELYGSSAGSGGPPMSPPFVLAGPHSPASLGSLDCA